MKRLIWQIRILGRIHRRIEVTETELSYFEESIIRPNLKVDELRYLKSRIEIKREVIAQLNNLLPLQHDVRTPPSGDTIDLMQYVTNMLYYAHIQARDMGTDEFDKWVESMVGGIDEYFKSREK